MKKYAVLLAINALILCGLSVNALLQISESCAGFGQCTTAVGPVTWGMALLPVLIIIGLGVAVLPKLIRGMKAERAERATRKAEAVEIARTAPSDAGIEEAMASRLMRVSRPSAAVAASDVDELVPAELVPAMDSSDADPALAVHQDLTEVSDDWSDNEPDSMPEWAVEVAVAAVDDASVEMEDFEDRDLGAAGFDGADRQADDMELASGHAADVDQSTSAGDAPTPPELVLAIDNEGFGDVSVPVTANELWAWLVNDGRVVQLHPAAQTGFPWAAAVVDEVAGAAFDLASSDELSSFAAEAAAWQAIVAEWHATQPIAGQDAESFVGWVNDLVVHCHLIGSGLTMAALLNRTMDRLDERCADDEELAAVLDTIFGIGDGEEDRRIGAN